MAISVSPEQVSRDVPDPNGHAPDFGLVEASREQQMAEIELLIEQIGARYVADLRELSQAFGRFYETRLDAKEDQLATMTRRAEAAERTCATLEVQLTDLRQARAHQAAELRALSEDLIRRAAEAERDAPDERPPT